MKFAIVTIDRYLGVFKAFVDAGWKPIKLFTTPATCALDDQAATIAYANRQGVAIQLSRLTQRDLAALKDLQCEALIVANYRWRVPDWRPYLKYAVNFHCSPLPEGRGPYPPIQALLKQRQSWAVACHQITNEFDDGAILDSESFPLQSDECHESLDLKIQMAANRLAERVATNFVNLWREATPQRDGSYWPKLKTQDHVIDFRQPVDDVLRHIRAFGAYGSLASVGAGWMVVTRAVGWTETHNLPPGTMVHSFGRSLVIAAKDGYVGILESQPAPLNIVADLLQINPRKSFLFSESSST